MTQRSQGDSRNTDEIFLGAAATHLSPGKYPDSKQPFIIIIIIMLIPGKKTHSMKGTKEKNEKGKEKSQVFTASMKTHIQLQPDASATILLTCPLSLAKEFSPIFGFAVKEMGSSPTPTAK